MGQSCLFDATTDSMDCAVVLATVMVKDCQIATIDTATRQYAYPLHVSKVNAFELEGEKDLDKTNPKILTFQVYGGNAQKAILILQGDQFSSLYYTEMGSHAHNLASLAMTAVKTDLGGHIHAVPHPANTDDAGNHDHGVMPGNAGTQGFNAISGSNDASQFFDQYIYWGHYGGAGGDKLPMTPKRFISTDGDHHHPYQVGPTDGPGSDSSKLAHGHSLEDAGTSIDAAGQAQYPVRTDAAYGYLTDLRVLLDGHDITLEIVGVLPPSWNRQLGFGSKDDPLNKKFGTGAIDLVGQLGKAITPEPHTLEFRVASGGGKIMWNLYVE
jgi:hypothetical protein